MKKLSPIAALLLLTAVVLMDVALFRKGEFLTELSSLRELLLIFAFAVLVNPLKTLRWINDNSVTGWLGALFFTLLGTIIIMSVAKFILGPAILAADQTQLKVYELPLRTYYHALVITVVAALMGILVLLIIRQLVFCKQRRGTAGKFRWLILFFIFYLAYVYFKGENLLVSSGEVKGNSTLGWVILFILVCLIVVNSFRASWINFLNKNQKFACMWGGFILIPAAGGLLWQFRESGIIYSFSPVIGSFLQLVALFAFMYVCVSFLAVLLHLPTAGLFDKKIREVASLHELSRNVGSLFDQEELAVKITQLTANVTECDFCWLEMLENTGRRLSVVSSQNLSEEEIAKINEHKEGNVSTWVLANQEAVSINVVSKDSRTQFLKNWRKRNVGSLLAVPLIFTDETRGVLIAGKAEAFGFEEDDRSILQAFANQATVFLENARLFQESLDKERFQEELKVAHAAQMKLLPIKMPGIHNLQLDATCITANEVGGDYYDFIELDDGRIGIVIGDVSGKGPSAAFYMAEIKGIIESYAQIYDSPKILLQKVNETVYANFDRKTFISVIYAVLDPGNKTIIFGRAGHCPLLYYHMAKGAHEFLQPSGIGLGLDGGAIFNRTLVEKKLRLKSGDVLLFFTDGVIEARNEQNEEFQENRLAQALAAVAGHSASEIKSGLVNNIDHFVGRQNRHDDLSFIILKAE